MALLTASDVWSTQTGSLSKDILQNAYQDAITYFTSELTRDECKRIWLKEKNDMQDIMGALEIARDKYEQRSKNAQVRLWLKKFSEGLVYYGAVVDTRKLSQHHPEYVSLVWGAIKFVFIGILNHEELISTFAKALAEIAHVLPRAKIKLRLYATPVIQDAVTQLFARVIQFVQRAVKWYNASKLKHIYYAIIRPASLTYSDLLEVISKQTQRIDNLASDAAQAEQRDMHNTLFETKQSVLEHRGDMKNTLLEIRQLMLTHQGLNSSKYLDMWRYLQQILHMQIVEFTAKSVLPSPHNTLQHYRVMAARRRARSRSILNKVRKSQALQEWGSITQSKILVVKGSFRTSHQARDVVTDVTSLIQSAGMPVVWVLNSKQDEVALQPSAADVLKLLVHQMMQINAAINETALNAAQFHKAQTESDWLEILAGLFQGLSQVYIVLDTEVLSDDVCEMPQWVDLFLELFEHLHRNSATTVVKVALLSYGRDSSRSTDLAAEYLVDLSKMKWRGLEKEKSSALHIRKTRKSYLRKQRYSGAQINT